MYPIVPVPLFVKPKPSLSLVDATAFTASSGATYSGGVFAGKSFGAEKRDRRLILALGARTNSVIRTVTSITIGGVAASLVPGTNINQSATMAEIWQALVPAGTTGDLVINLSGSMECIGCALYRLVDYDSITPTGAAAVAGDLGAAGVNMKNTGVALAFAVTLVSGAQTHTWTGINKEGDLKTDDSQNTNHTFGSYQATAPETPHAITCDSTSNPAAGNMVTVAASFR